MLTPVVGVDALVDIELAEFPAVHRWWHAINERPAILAGTGSKDLAPPPSYGQKRAKLTPEQWSNLFGARMLAAAENTGDPPPKPAPD